MLGLMYTWPNHTIKCEWRQCFYWMIVELLVFLLLFVCTKRAGILLLCGWTEEARREDIMEKSFYLKSLLQEGEKSSDRDDDGKSAFSKYCHRSLQRGGITERKRRLLNLLLLFSLLQTKVFRFLLIRSKYFP